MEKSYKLMFLTTTIASSLIAISAYSWFGMWMGLEINLLSIVPLFQSKSNQLSAEASIKYFITQSMASTIILMAIILASMKSNLNFNPMVKTSSTLMMNTGLMTKMGMPPFHFWFPEVLEGLSWMNCMLIMTWQKLAPMVIIMYNLEFNTFTFLVISTTMIISGIQSMNQTSLRKLLAYSSMNHMGWMISSMMAMKTIWMIYFMVYSLITINIIMMMNTVKTYYLNQMYSSMNENPISKMMFMMNFLSMSGMPPFIGFFPKWLTIQVLSEKKMFMLTMIMIIFTMLMIFNYLRISVTSFLMNMNEKKWKPVKPSKKLYLMMTNSLSIMSLIMMTITFNMT